MALRDRFDVRHPLFRPLWVRLLLLALAAGWTGYELVNGNWIWAGIFGVATAYLGWEWLVAYDPAKYEDRHD